MKIKSENSFSKRERQIMNIIYKKGCASVAEIQEELPDKVNYSTVRALLRILTEKKHLTCESQGTKYIYYPVVPKENAAKNAIKELMSTFFNDSLEEAVQGLLVYDGGNLSEEEINKLSELINNAKGEDTDD